MNHDVIRGTHELLKVKTIFYLKLVGNLWYLKMAKTICVVYKTEQHLFDNRLIYYDSFLPLDGCKVVLHYYSFLIN